MKREIRWAIPDAAGATPEERYWPSSHRDSGYSDVFSVTEDPVLQTRIFVELRRYLADFHGPVRVLVPGCGSRAVLEPLLATQFPNANIVATDFRAVVELAAERAGPAPRLQYEARDSRQLGYQSQFDAAVVINSILSGIDSDNRAMVSSIASALKPGGFFIGLFPTIFAAIDIAECEPAERWRKQLIDIRNSRYYEETQGRSQIFYTPLRLRQIFKEAALVDLVIEIYFCDSEHMLREADRIYGLHGEDLVLYEMLVRARKP